MERKKQLKPKNCEKVGSYLNYVQEVNGTRKTKATVDRPLSHMNNVFDLTVQLFCNFVHPLRFLYSVIPKLRAGVMLVQGGGEDNFVIRR